MKRIVTVILLMLSAGVWWIAAAFAQGYPNKTIKVIVPSAPGGGPDIMGRLFAQKLSEGLGQAVIVENRAGAGGTIGTDAVAKAAPDGYTLLLGGATYLSVAPALYPTVTYDSVNSFAPISLIGTTTYVMMTAPAVQARSLKELIALAKSRPGHLNYGASSIGTPSHLIMEMVKSAAGLDIVGINFVGSAQALTSLFAGDTQVVVDQIAPVMPLIASGKVRPLAITSDKRSKQLPDLPTVSEAGIPGFKADGWFGVLAPKGTPNDIVKRLNGEMVKAISNKELMAHLERQGVEPAPGTPEEFLSLLKADAVFWATAVKVSGAKVH